MSETADLNLFFTLRKFFSRNSEDTTTFSWNSCWEFSHDFLIIPSKCLENFRCNRKYLQIWAQKYIYLYFSLVSFTYCFQNFIQHNEFEYYILHAIFKRNFDTDTEDFRHQTFLAFLSSWVTLFSKIKLGKHKLNVRIMFFPSTRLLHTVKRYTSPCWQHPNFVIIRISVLFIT